MFIIELIKKRPIKLFSIILLKNIFKKEKLAALGLGKLSIVLSCFSLISKIKEKQSINKVTNNKFLILLCSFFYISLYLFDYL